MTRGFAAGLSRLFAPAPAPVIEETPGAEQAAVRLLMARAAGWLFVSGASLGGVALMFFDGARTDRWAVGGTLALAALVGLALLGVGSRAPRWLLFYGVPAAGTLVIGLLVAFSHDGASPYSFFYIWVSLWVFYFLSRTMAIAQVVFVGITYAAVLAAGSPGPNPAARWVVAMGTVAVAGWLIASLAHDLRQRTRSMSLLLDATRALAATSDPESARPVICDALKRFGDATMTALYEPDADGAALRLTATSAGATLADKPLYFVGARSAAIRAFVEAQAIFVGDMESDPRVDRELARRMGMRSGLWHPVQRHGQPVGVLAAFWEQPQMRVPRGFADLAALLASEAATTIDRADLMDRLVAVARTDDLTGLPNRRAWTEELPTALLRANRAGEDVCVALLDLDHFKAFNDEHGHQAGDRMLKEAAGAWGSRLRATDILARYGGEEFALVLPGCDIDRAVAVVEQLRASTPAQQTCSVGVALWDTKEAPDAVLRRADTALYEAKRAGRDRTAAAA